MNVFSRICVVGLATLACIIFVASCNTVEGAGRDIEETGEAVQDAAD